MNLKQHNMLEADHVAGRILSTKYMVFRTLTNSFNMLFMMRSGMKL